jgi:hypothetical protein
MNNTSNHYSGGLRPKDSTQDRLMASMVPDIRRVVGLPVSDWSIEHNERSFGLLARAKADVVVLSTAKDTGTDQGVS